MSSELTLALAKHVVQPLGCYRVAGMKNCYVTVAADLTIAYAFAYVDGQRREWRPAVG